MSCIKRVCPIKRSLSVKAISHLLYWSVILWMCSNYVIFIILSWCRFVTALVALLLNYFIFLSATAGEHSACSGTHKSPHDKPQPSLPFFIHWTHVRKNLMWNYHFKLALNFFIFIGILMLNWCILFVIRFRAFSL